MDTSELKGHLILIMAPSGSGKGVLVKHLLETFPELHFAVSCTTRPIREGEKDGREYYFLTKEAFRQKIEADDFVEWAEYGGNYYGTLKTEIIDNLKAGKAVLNEIELQGVQSLHTLIPPVVRTTIFIDAGSWETLEKRILNRAPLSDEELELRRQRYQKEIKAKDLADVVIDNQEGQLEEAKAALRAITQTIIDKLTQ